MKITKSAWRENERKWRRNGNGGISKAASVSTAISFARSFAYAVAVALLCRAGESEGNEGVKSERYAFMR